MRILMVSPHPTYSPRGTPISVFNRCVALGALGHQVDLVTYPVGEDRPADGLRYLRARVPGFRSVPVGPSAAKLVLNGAVAAASLRQAVRGRGEYDAVHSHEEAGLFGPVLARLAGVPHLYDMGNDWSEVLCNYGLARGNPLTRVAATLEDSVISRSQAIIAHFPLIADRVRAVGSIPVETVFNVPIELEADPATAASIRRSWAPEGSTVVLYAGTLEPYQGVHLLVEAMAEVARRHPASVLVVVGGRTAQVEQLRRTVGESSVGDHVRLVGQVDSSLIPSCLMAADVLVSPRERGSNTPLKIFSYLRSGRPIVATDITSHTQVLDHTSATLVAPTAPGLADGISSVLAAGRRRSMAPGSPAAGRRYGVEEYVAGVARAYVHLGGAQVTDQVVRTASARITAGLGPALGGDDLVGPLSELLARSAVRRTGPPVGTPV
jgi:glycosyltransferase involved in cell wall biosynthesis